MRAWQKSLATGAALMLWAAPLAAQDGGLVDLHAKVRVGGKLCMADHYHSGSSSGAPSRKAAEAAAVRSWQDFTAWEYGGAWGNFGMSEGRRVTCTGSASSWGCDVESRACRRR